jgi:hypothetical protein
MEALNLKQTPNISPQISPLGLDDCDEGDTDAYNNPANLDLDNSQQADSISVQFADGKAISLSSKKETLSQLKTHLFDITNQLFNNKIKSSGGDYFG